MKQDLGPWLIIVAAERLHGYRPWKATRPSRSRGSGSSAPAQLAMLLSARKEPGKYTEGAVLGAHFQSLVRIVPPPLALAHAMTEPEEKAERLRIMRHRHCTELEAAYGVTIE
jgi:hypothetical protein